MNRRLLPLQIAVFLQGLGFWAPIEKLFMTEIGFDAASVGLMAAAYAAFTPVVEIPSGILADRWSLRLPETSSVLVKRCLVNSHSPALMARDHHGRMTGRAAATGLPRPDQYLRQGAVQPN